MKEDFCLANLVGSGVQRTSSSIAKLVSWVLLPPGLSWIEFTSFKRAKPKGSIVYPENCRLYIRQTSGLLRALVEEAMNHIWIVHQGSVHALKPG